MPITARLFRAAALIKAFEPFHAGAVRSGEGWTVGYGHTASAREGAQVSREEADALLLYDLRRVAATVDASVYAPLNDNQRQALTAFGFNIGTQNLLGSTAMRRLNAGDYLGAAREIERWRMAELAGEDQVVDALVRRRAAEKALFLTPSEGFPKTPTTVLRPQFDAQPDASFTPSSPAEPPSAAMAAAQGVSERLRALVPEPEPTEPGPPIEVDDGDDTYGRAEAPQSPFEENSASLIAPIQSADRHDGLDMWRSVEEASPPPFVDARQGFQPPHPANQAEGPVVDLADRENLREVEVEPQRSAAPVGPATPAASKPEPAKPKSITPQRMRRDAPVLGLLRRGHIALGVLGAVLFAIAVFSIVVGRPSAANLVLGLLGVICLVPAVFVLLGGSPPSPR